MRINKPAAEQVPQLLVLWKAAFGDWDGFWELFLSTAFHPDRCRCITEDGSVTASLCWFNCRLEGRKLAYVYAVVTHPEHRNRGLCRKLLADTQALLAGLGYAAVLLVPESESLRQMYEKLGYRTCTTVTEFSCPAADRSLSLRAIGPAEYAALRRRFLPLGGVVQEGENLSFLAAQAQFFAGKDFLLAAYQEGATLHGMELLGNQNAASGITAALDCQEGRFRCPGDGKEFAMWLPLTGDAVAPKYFGFAFD